MKLKTGIQQRKLVKQIADYYRTKLSKINKTLARLIKIKRKKTLITNIKNETRNITTDTIIIKRIILKNLWTTLYCYIQQLQRIRQML